MAKLARPRMRRGPALILGLVLASSAAVGWSLSRPLPEYLIASQNFAAGARLGVEGLQGVGLDLKLASGNYLLAKEFVPGQVLLQPLRAGELLPSSVLAPAPNPNFSTVIIRPAAPIAQSIILGSKVSLWRVGVAARTVISEPEQLITTAEVVAVLPATGLFAEDHPSVELRIPVSKIAAVLQAMAAEHPLYLLPATR